MSCKKYRIVEKERDGEKWFYFEVKFLCFWMNPMSSDYSSGHYKTYDKAIENYKSYTAKTTTTITEID